MSFTNDNFAINKKLYKPHEYSLPCHILFIGVCLHNVRTPRTASRRQPPEADSAWQGRHAEGAAADGTFKNTRKCKQVGFCAGCRELGERAGGAAEGWEGIGRCASPTGRRVKVERAWWQHFDRFISFAAVVMLVEFALLFLDPWLDRVTGGLPLWRMAANVGIAIVITPVHGLVEARLRSAKQETSEGTV